MTLSELRIWHWQRVESHRKSERKYKHLIECGHPAQFYNERKVRDHRRNADFHLKAVQALNDVLTTTVFQDIERNKHGH